MSILTATTWPSNAELIVDVANLGYIAEDDIVLDATYKDGVWWKKFKPPQLVTNDLDERVICQTHYDFCAFPYIWVEHFNVVALDPPYKLNGTPSAPDAKYGVDVAATWQERNALIKRGIIGCAEVLKKHGYLLLKCQDQVARNHKRWQTIEFTNHAEKAALDLVDRFDMLGKPRKQPGNRPQRHTHSNYSTLLVFRKVK